MTGARFAVRGVDQLFEDAAVGDAMSAGALRAQGLELHLERLQGLSLGLDALDALYRLKALQKDDAP